MSSSSVPDGHARRRSFTPAQKLTYLSGYETACETGQGGAFLGREGLYSSLIFDVKIDALDAKFDAKIDALDHKIDALDATMATRIDHLDRDIQFLMRRESGEPTEP